MHQDNLLTCANLTFLLSRSAILLGCFAVPVQSNQVSLFVIFPVQRLYSVYNRSQSMGSFSERL